MSKIKVALGQISPIWLNRKATEVKIIETIKQAASEQADLIVFGEGLLPGYPFWLSMTNGSEFENDEQKDIHAHYANNAVYIERGDLNNICKACSDGNISTYLGIIERPLDRGGHSLYCSLVYINQAGVIQSVHRKLQPTYEERLTWSLGDGHGLRVHDLNGFTLGGLNCWENWMPLPRAALYGQGENVHIAVWPGSVRNTADITRFIAKESRSYVISVSSLLQREHITDDIPHQKMIIANCPEVLADGGSCIAAPDGSWLVAPYQEETLRYAELDYTMILRERQNFDPSGHYSRPDVTQLHVNRKRQRTVEFED